MSRPEGGPPGPRALHDPRLSLFSPRGFSRRSCWRGCCSGATSPGPPMAKSRPWRSRGRVRIRRLQMLLKNLIPSLRSGKEPKAVLPPTDRQARALRQPETARSRRHPGSPWLLIEPKSRTLLQPRRLTRIVGLKTLPIACPSLRPSLKRRSIVPPSRVPWFCPQRLWTLRDRRVLLLKLRTLGPKLPLRTQSRSLPRFARRCELKKLRGHRSGKSRRFRPLSRRNSR